jgi:general stress protein YciG
MPFTRDTAREAGRKGGLACLAAHGREHMAEIGRLGFAALARRRGFVGGARLGALQFLLSKGRLRDRGPDPTEAFEWAERVLDALDLDNPDVPY